MPNIRSLKYVYLYEKCLYTIYCMEYKKEVNLTNTLEINCIFSICIENTNFNVLKQSFLGMWNAIINSFVSKTKSKIK